MPKKGLDPVQEGLPPAVQDVVADLRTIYTDGPYDRLRAVEAAIDLARTQGADLVTVSSATSSRMLSPRRTEEGRTALPRWPSVRSFLAVHHVDAGPFEARWARAREEWAAADGAPVPVPARRDGRAVLLGLVGLLLFGAGTGFGLFLGRDGDRGGVPTEAVAAVSLPGAAEQVGPTGVNCALGGTADTDVRFRSVASADGRPGIAPSIRADVEVVRPADPGTTYWLMLRLSTDGLPYFAKARVRADSGPASYVLRFDSPIGSVQDLLVVRADAAATEWLRQSVEHDRDLSGAKERGTLPPGVSTVSGTCRVERTR